MIDVLICVHSRRRVNEQSEKIGEGMKKKNMERVHEGNKGGEVV